MRKKVVLLLSIIVILSSCMKGESADLILHNGSIFTLNDNNDIHQAIAIKDGKILEVAESTIVISVESGKLRMDKAAVSSSSEDKLTATAK